MTSTPSHVDGVVKQHEAQVANPETSHEQREASKDAISRLKVGDVSDRELGSNTPTPEERQRNPQAHAAAEVAESAAKALPEDAEKH